MTMVRFPTGIRRPDGTRMRLAGLVMAAVVICMFVGQIIWLIPTYSLEYAAVHKEAEQRARDLIKAAVDPTVFPTVQYEKDRSEERRPSESGGLCP